MKKTILLIAFVLLCCINLTNAQAISRISGRCVSPNNSFFGSVVVTSAGNINYTPCPTKSSIFTGNVDFSGATIIGSGFVTGNGNSPFIPLWTTGTSIGNSGISFTTNNTYKFDNATNDATNFIRFITGDNAGSVAKGVIGSVLQAGGNYGLDVNTFIPNAILLGNVNDAGVHSLLALQSTSDSSLRPENGRQLLVGFNSVPLTRRAQITFNPVGNTISYQTSVLDLSDASLTLINLNRTLTASGTTGAQTINKPNGTVNFAAGASTLVVTNGIAIATSTINAVAQSNDATCSVKSITRAVGSFTITMTAACTAETPVAFWVWN